MKTYCLLNHNLTENQLVELKEKYDTDLIIYPSEELSRMWSQVSACSSIDYSLINAVLDWLEDAEESDLLIVQGESGHSFVIVDWALQNHLIPLHAVSQRIETESVDGERVVKQHIFCHACFRKYERYSDKKRNIK